MLETFDVYDNNESCLLHKFSLFNIIKCPCNVPMYVPFFIISFYYSSSQLSVLKLNS